MTVAFYVARHGETIFNVMNRVQGWCDTPLTAAGEQAAAELGRRLANRTFVAGYSSDSGRARTTLEIAWKAWLQARGEAIPEELPLHADSRLREWCYGQLEGEDRQLMQDALAACFGEVLPRSYHNRELPRIADYLATIDTTGRAENFVAIEARLRSFLREVGAKIEAQGGGNVLVVTHAFTVRTLVYLFDRARVNEPEKIGNASFTELIWDNGEVTVGRIGVPPTRR